MIYVPLTHDANTQDKDKTDQNKPKQTKTRQDKIRRDETRQYIPNDHSSLKPLFCFYSGLGLDETIQYTPNDHSSPRIHLSLCSVSILIWGFVFVCLKIGSDPVCRSSQPAHISAWGRRPHSPLHSLSFLLPYPALSSQTHTRTSVHIYSDWYTMHAWGEGGRGGG